MNKKLTKNAKTDFEKKIFKLMRKQRCQPCNNRKFIIHGNEKTQIFMNRSVYLDLLILEISKKVMHEFWYDCMKSEYREKAKLCYMDTDSFKASINTEDTFTQTLEKMMEQDLILQTMNQIGHSPKKKNKKVLDCMFLSCHVRIYTL